MSGGSHRPDLKLQRTPADNILEAVAILSLLAMGLLIVHYWPAIPDRVPTHFGATGQPDSFGGKGSLFFLPVLSICMYVMLTVFYRFPQIYNYPTTLTEQNAARQYSLARTMMQLLKAEVLLIFCYMEWQTIDVALAGSSGMGKFFLPLLLLATTGPLILYIYVARRSQ
jgi:uncharacterized membrane protein